MCFIKSLKLRELFRNFIDFCALIKDASHLHTQKDRNRNYFKMCSELDFLTSITFRLKFVLHQKRSNLRRDKNLKFLLPHLISAVKDMSTI